ncbi:MAG: hypothetical protein ACREQI_14520 [Candidatus Binataceae bacterium]
MLAAERGRAAGNRGPITLSRSDWEEIYAALWTKRDKLMNGDYRGADAPDEARDERKWAKQLSRIIDAIGADGEDAAARGVKEAHS